MLTRSQLENLDHSELVEYTLSLSDIKDQLYETEKRITEIFESKIEEIKKATDVRIEKLEGELAVAKNANIILRDEIDKHNGDLHKRVSSLEKETYKTAEYQNFETVEISKIPLNIPDNEVGEVTLNILNSMLGNDDVEISWHHVHAIHRRQGHFTKEKVLVKFVSRNDAHHVLKRAKRLKDIKLEEMDERLVEPVYINEFLSPYYSKLRYACKLLHNENLVESFRSNGHKIRVTLGRGKVERLIQHKNDLVELFPDEDISEILSTCRL